VAVGGIGTLAVIALWSVLFPALRSYDRVGSDSAGESHARV